MYSFVINQNEENLGKKRATIVGCTLMLFPKYCYCFFLWDSLGFKHLIWIFPTPFLEVLRNCHSFNDS